MPAKGTCLSCSTKDIQDAVRYMVNAASGKAASAMGSPPVDTPPKQLTLADGKKVYGEYCAVCHEANSNYPGAPKTGDKAAWEPLIKKGMGTLFIHSIRGYKNMPAKGGCPECSNAQVIAAVKFMVNKSKTKGDYVLW